MMRRLMLIRPVVTRMEASRLWIFKRVAINAVAVPASAPPMNAIGRVSVRVHSRRDKRSRKRRTEGETAVDGQVWEVKYAKTDIDAERNQREDQAGGNGPEPNVE